MTAIFMTLQSSKMVIYREISKSHTNEIFEYKKNCDLKKSVRKFNNNM